MPKHHPEQLKIRIILMKDQGFTHKKIEKKTGVKIKTIEKIVSRCIKHGTITRLKGSGRPQIFQLSDQKSLESILSEKTNKTNRKIRRKLSAETKKEFKRTTVQREIKKIGFKVTKPILKPVLEYRHLNLRLNFSKKYLF